MLWCFSHDTAVYQISVFICSELLTHSCSVGTQGSWRVGAYMRVTAGDVLVCTQIWLFPCPLSVCVLFYANQFQMTFAKYLGCWSCVLSQVIKCRAPPFNAAALLPVCLLCFLICLSPQHQQMTQDGSDSPQLVIVLLTNKGVSKTIISRTSQAIKLNMFKLQGQDPKSKCPASKIGT